MTARTLVCVPMKDPRLAKSRLADALSNTERARFAWLLFTRTVSLLTTLRDSGAAAEGFDIAVVTGCARVARHTSAQGLPVIAEGAATSLSGAVSRAARQAEARGHERLCVLPADLAAPDPADLARFLDTEIGRRGVALCPSRDFGTNALLAAPPAAIAFAYGPGSFHAHCRNARAAGLTPIVRPLESLRWDIDRSPDLAAFRASGPALPGGTAP